MAVSFELDRECVRPGCGNRFASRSVRHKYCSDQCKRAATDNAARNKRIAASHAKTCKRCGQSFTAKNVRKMNCPACDAADIARRENHELDFIGVDGEGHGEGKDHVYALIGCGSEQLENPAGLQWHEIFSFLYRQYQGDPQAVYAGFFLGYDFNQWIKTLPWHRARKLLTAAGQAERRSVTKRGGVQYLPVDCTAPDGSRWQIKMLGDKRMQFRPKPGEWHDVKASLAQVAELFAMVKADGYRTRKSPDPGRYRYQLPKPGHIKYRIVRRNSQGWMSICDAGPFFQCSLLSAIDRDRRAREGAPQIVDPEEYAVIVEGKRLRGGSGSYRVLGIPWFDNLRDDEKTRAYNRLENDILSRLLTELNTGFTAAGIRLGKSQWFGPGQAAQGWLRNNQEIPSREAAESAVPVLFRDAARESYYGGWFEIMAHGLIPGTTYEYDINSAYPSVISRLPCLLHGKYSTGDNYSRKAKGYLPGLPSTRSVRLVYAHVIGSHPRIGTMLHRRVDLSIRRPWETTGWFWQHELTAAQRAGLIDQVDYLKWHTYKPCPCSPPLRGVRGLYEDRLAVGKGSPRGKAYKLVYNSMYGKFAQSAGEPMFANPVYASLITAGCRTMILDAIASHPLGADAVVMVATDGIYFISPHPGLNLSKQLGDWECEPHENLTLFKPGVYWDDATRKAIAKGVEPHLKSRGVNAAAFSKAIADIDRQFKDWPDAQPVKWPEVSFPVSFSMRTCKQALAVPEGVASQTLQNAGSHGPSCSCRACVIQRRNWKNAGLVISDLMVTQMSDPLVKRNPELVFDGRIWWSSPWPGARNKAGRPEKSIPYDKSFGSAVMQELGLVDQNEYGLSPDGPVDDLVFGVIGTGQFAG